VPEAREGKRGRGVSCQHPAKWLEGLYIVDGGVFKCFATIPVCAKCMRPQGDPRPFKTTKPPKEYNATSWAVMLRVHPYPPYHFVLNAKKTLLVPQTYNENDDKELV
jgi:hypothetical protein